MLSRADLTSFTKAMASKTGTTVTDAERVGGQFHDFVQEVAAQGCGVGKIVSKMVELFDIFTGEGTPAEKFRAAMKLVGVNAEPSPALLARHTH